MNPAERILAPHSVAEFFERYYERAPLHISRDEDAYFAEAYSIAELEDSLVTGSREVERFALVKRDEPAVEPEEYTTLRGAPHAAATKRPPVRCIDPRKVVSFFTRGYTLVVRDAGPFSPRLQRYCTALARGLQCYVQANVYLTPPNAQGFEAHHDTHDTLVVQIDGRKTWRVYEPLVALPLESQPFSGAQSTELKLHKEVTLQPGDTLYLPRGFIHEAAADAARALHVTFALAPVRVADLLAILVELAAERSLSLRHSLAGGWRHDSTFANVFGGHAIPAFLAACTPELIERAREIALTEEFGLVRGDALGAFDALATIDAFPAGALVTVRDDVPLDIRSKPGSVEALAPSRKIGFPPFCKAALEQLAAGPVRYGEIDPSLTDENRYLLVRLLVLEGIADVAYSSPSK